MKDNLLSLLYDNMLRRCYFGMSTCEPELNDLKDVKSTKIIFFKSYSEQDIGWCFYTCFKKTVTKSL